MNPKLKSFLSEYWIGIIILLIPIIFGLWFVTALLNVYDEPSISPYSDNPSISDEDWLKDNYGGTEYYP